MEFVTSAKVKGYVMRLSQLHLSGVDLQFQFISFISKQQSESESCKLNR